MHAVRLNIFVKILEKKMQNFKPQWNHALYGLALTVLFMSGCATDRGPVAELAVSRAAVADAVAAGGTQYAPLETASARDKLIRAENAMAAKDYRVARDLANQSEADAKLAESKANTAKAQKTADVVNDDARVLREELARKQK
jgi:hypothetical protein